MVVPTVTNFFEAVMVSLAAAMMTLLSFIPALIGAVILLVVGWILSGFAGRIVSRVLQRVGFETAATRTGVTDFMHRSGSRLTASVVMGEIVKWFIRLIFIEAAAQAVHLDAVTQLINRIILFIPNLVVALVVLMIGLLIARFVAGLVQGSASEAGIRNAGLLGAIAKYAIITFAVIVAVNQVGIASTLVNTLFMAIVGALALAFGLAFGLGGRDVASQMTEGWYRAGRTAAPRLQQAAERSTAPAAATAPEAAPSPRPQPASAPRPEGVQAPGRRPQLG